MNLVFLIHLFENDDGSGVTVCERCECPSDLFLLGATMGLGLEEVYELGLLSDGPFHFHLLMRVHSLQVELSEHHYCHEFQVLHFTQTG